MSEKNSAPKTPHHALLQTILPSAIRRSNNVGASSNSTANTLRGVPDEHPLPQVDSESLPDGWTRVKHPDSGVYYVNEDKRISTVCNVFDTRLYALVKQGIEALHASQALKGLREGEAVDVVVDVRQNKACYYCVSHVDRGVFWLQDMEHAEVQVSCPSNKCTNSMGSKAHCIEAQYWKHCELFPTTFNVTKEVTGTLKAVLLQAAADRLLVKFSTSPYDKEALGSMLDMVKDVEEDVREERDARQGSGHAAWIIARFMALYNDGVLQSSYGQVDDYFDIEDTGPAIGPYKRPILLTIFGPLFLKSPDIYAVELHSFHENFTLERWRSFVSKVDSSVRDSNLLATVLLSTNVGLLSWEGSGGTGGISNPTVAQIVTYISIICTVGSIIIGLAIFKQYRAKRADTPLRAVVVLRRILREPFGLERLAIICSLPYVLLMWALIAFLVALSILFYENTGTHVRIAVSVALFLNCLCLFFCLYTAGPPDREEQKPQKPSRGGQDATSSKV